MNLTRCTAQGPTPLEDTYATWARRGLASGVDGDTMVELLAQLRGHDDTRSVWCLTSLATLCLLASDDPATPWFVRVHAHGPDHIEVAHRAPPALVRGEDIYTLSEARHLDEAVALVVHAMDQSGGWSDP